MKEEREMNELKEFLEKLRRLHERDRESSAGLEEARRDAVAILRKAEEGLAEIYLSIGEGVKREGEKERAAVDKEIAAFRAKAEKARSKEARALEREAEKNRGEAVAFILGRVGVGNA